VTEQNAEHLKPIVKLQMLIAVNDMTQTRLKSCNIVARWAFSIGGTLNFS